MKTPRPVSFIVPVFNAVTTLRQSIESIVDGNLLKDDEIIIVDDASQDGSLALAYELAGLHPQVKVVRHNSNKGSANAGRNTGVDHARHDLLFNLDADNILLPGSVVVLRDHLESSNCDVVAFGVIEYFDDETLQTTHQWTMREKITFIGNINAVSESPGGSGNFLYSRKAWLRAGRCTEAVGAAYDSWAFSVDLLGTGSVMECVPGTRYRHRVSPRSSFLRTSRQRNVSLLKLQVLIPYLQLIHPDDVDRIMESTNRLTWSDDPNFGPLRSVSGSTEVSPASPQRLLPHELPTADIMAMLARKFRRRIVSPFARHHP